MSRLQDQLAFLVDNCIRELRPVLLGCTVEVQVTPKPDGSCEISWEANGRIDVCAKPDEETVP